MLYLKVLNARLFSNWLTFLASCCHLLPEITGMAEIEHVQDVKYILMTQTCTRVKQETYILTRWLMLTDNMYLVFRFFFFCFSICLAYRILYFGMYRNQNFITFLSRFLEKRGHRRVTLLMCFFYYCTLAAQGYQCCMLLSSSPLHWYHLSLTLCFYFSFSEMRIW